MKRCQQRGSESPSALVKLGRTRIQGMLDIYNVFNANTVLVTNTRYGPSWCSRRPSWAPGCSSWPRTLTSSQGLRAQRRI